MLMRAVVLCGSWASVFFRDYGINVDVVRVMVCLVINMHVSGASTL